jgi:RNA polymerase sigma-70 factor (ECF subfamily)
VEIHRILILPDSVSPLAFHRLRVTLLWILRHHDKVAATNTKGAGTFNPDAHSYLQTLMLNAVVHIKLKIRLIKNRMIGVTTEREIDQILVERVQRGDKKAFELLVSKHQRKLMRLVSRLIYDQAEAEDVVQEAFIKAYRALPNFVVIQLYTWLYRIGINTAKNYLVTQGRRAPTSTDADVDEAETFVDADGLRDINTPESLLASKQIAETVNAAMSLPEELRKCITLREIEGLSYDEIADVMLCPIGTVRSRIFRAREAIAERLRPILGTNLDQRW